MVELRHATTRQSRTPRETLPLCLRLRLLVAFTSIACLPACARPFYERWSERVGNETVSAVDEQVLAYRERDVRRPGDANGLAEPDTREPPVIPFDDTHLKNLSLREALQLAIRNNRDYKARREQLFLVGLSVNLTRHNFGPLFDGTLRYLFEDNPGSPGMSSESADISVSQILPTGGNVLAALSGDASQPKNTTETGSDPSTWSAGASVVVVQPILEGAGYAVTHEPLIQAERDIVYAVRSFEVYREDFTIALMQSHYALVASKETVRNQRENYERQVFSAQKAQALYEVGRQNLVEALRAQNDQLDAQNALLGVEETYRNQLDSFKILLGLPVDMDIDVAGDRPTLVEVAALDVEEAIRCAHANRLDLATSADLIEDAGRGVDIAGNRLLPALDATLSYGLDTPVVGELHELDRADSSFSVGVAMEIPFDRWQQRNQLAAADIQLAQAERGYSRARDEVANEIRAGIRRLERAKISITLAQAQIDISQRERDRAEFLLQAGEIDNRDVTTAQNSLTQAKNDHVNRIVDYEIARVQLLRDLGILFLDEDGVVK